jgi:hypothetical protein
VTYEDLDMPQTWIPRAAVLLLAAATVLDTGCSSSTGPTTTERLLPM